MYTRTAIGITRDSDGAPLSEDMGNVDWAAYVAWLQEGNEPKEAPGPSFEQRAAALLMAVDAHLNSAAQAKGYDSIVTAALRAALPQSVFHDEGVAFGNWMDEVYATCYATMAAVQAGELEEPTEAELIALLPDLVLPT